MEGVRRTEGVRSRLLGGRGDRAPTVGMEVVQVFGGAVEAVEVDGAVVAGDAAGVGVLPEGPGWPGWGQGRFVCIAPVGDPEGAVASPFRLNYGAKQRRTDYHHSRVSAVTSLGSCFVTETCSLACDQRLK